MAATTNTSEAATRSGCGCGDDDETHELEGLLNHTSTQTPTHTHTRARVYNEWSGEERAEGGVRAEGSREKRRATDDEAEKRERETRGGSNEVALKPSLLFRDSLMRLASAKSAVLLPRAWKAEPVANHGINVRNACGDSGMMELEREEFFRPSSNENHRDCSLSDPLAMRITEIRVYQTL